MQNKLAIHGGTRTISQSILNRLPAWPPVFPEVPDGLKQVYNSRRWSFNESIEQRFCTAFAQHHSAGFGVFMVNGTVTLECALAALGVGSGDEVIIPALTWMATAMSAVYLGAKPVFVDIEPDTMCLDPVKLKAAITKKTKAIIPVHLYGSMADMEAILDIANKHGIPVIEDCAHAHGGMWAGRGVGSLGAVGSFSFQQSKTLSSGEGGMCITSNGDLAAKMYRLKHIGYDFMSGQGKAASSPPEGLVCHNYRGTEFQAVILLESLKHLQEQTELRDANAKYLGKLIGDIPGIEIQARGRLADLQGYYIMFFLFDLAKWNNISLNRLMEIFGAEGLGLMGTYGPVYSHALWNIPASGYRKADACSTCETLCKERAAGLFHNWLLADKETIEAVAGTIRKVWKNRKELK
jgi:L-glutamine:2-deoxy-scyllo-inosose/3-amino-2,3-dideoxy-scyllo-inosose aminotransferase